MTEATKEITIPSPTTTRFGVNQIGNPTPQWATNIFRIVLYTAAAANIVVLTVTQIPPDVQKTIAQISIEAVTLVHALSKLLGVTIDNDPTSK